MSVGPGPTFSGGLVLGPGGLSPCSSAPRGQSKMQSASLEFAMTGPVVQAEFAAVIRTVFNFFCPWDVVAPMLALCITDCAADDKGYFMVCYMVSGQCHCVCVCNPFVGPG